MSSQERNIVLGAFVVYGVVLVVAVLVAVDLSDQLGEKTPLLGRRLHEAVLGFGPRDDPGWIGRAQVTVLGTAIGLGVIPLAVAASLYLSKQENQRRLRRAAFAWSRGLRLQVTYVATVVRKSKPELLVAMLVAVVLALLAVGAVPLLQIAAEKKWLALEYDATVKDGLQQAVRSLVVQVGLAVQSIAAALMMYALYKGDRRAQMRGVCPHCGYSLRGCFSDRCPECGTLRLGRGVKK